MFKENENMAVDMDTNRTSKNINEKRSNQEEKITLLPSLSIEQKSSQENRKIIFNNEMMKEEEDDEQQQQQLNYYNKLSDNEIKERLLKKTTATSDDVYLSIRVHQWLEKNRILFQFIREHASLLAKYFSFKMELELYQSYIQMTEPMLPWLSTLSKPLLIRNHMNHDQFFQIQKYVNKQLKSLEEKFRIITGKLAKSISDQQQASSATSSEVDIKSLTSLIVKFVQEDQQRLNIELIKKRHLLMLHVKDISLLREFYYLQPTSQQLIIAEKIWKATIDEQRAHPTMTNKEQNRFGTVDDRQQIELQKKQLSSLNITNEKGENLLPMNYLQLNLDLLMNIIESRQKILINRLQFDNDYKQMFILDDDNNDNRDSEKQ